MSKKQKQEKSDDGAPAKPKEIAKAVFTIYDDGQITEDMTITEPNAVGKNKKWTVEAIDFVRYLFRVQPRNVTILATAFNTWIARARLPLTSQGIQVMCDAEGRLSQATPGIDSVRSPVASVPDKVDVAGRIAAGVEANAAKAIGLTGSDLIAAVPDAPADPPGKIPDLPPLGSSQ